MMRQEPTKHLNRQAKYPSTCQNPRGLISAPVSFARRRSKAPDNNLSFEMELAINVHKPTILLMMLLVSRTISTSLRFTCIIPMRTGEIQQRKNRKHGSVFIWLPSWRRDFLISLKITKSCQRITDPITPELSLYLPAYFLCLNGIFPSEREIIIRL